jgi:hypothetical protein
VTPSDRWRLGVIAACVAIFALASPFAAIKIEWATFVPIYLMAAFLTAIGLSYRAMGRDAGIAATTLIVAQVLVYSNVVALDNYLGLELRRPLNDAFLAQIDTTLGLDWHGYVNWVKSSSVFGWVLTAAYESSLIQVAVVIIALGFTQRLERLDKFSLAFMFASALTIAIWAVFPSLGALPLHYAQGLAEPPFHLAMTKAEAFKLLALHAGPTPTLHLDDMTGLIGCPSFHTALAMLTIFALWRTPVLGPLSIAVNVLVLLSIPADGGHHFVDVLAGGAVTAVSLYFADLGLRPARAPALAAPEPQVAVSPGLPA